MKLLDENRMLELLEATAADREQLAQRMGRTLDRRTDDWFKSAVQNPAYKVTTVNRDGRKLGAIWWWFSANNSALVLNAGASFARDLSTTPDFMKAYDILAKRVGATSMELTTARPGVVKVYRENGWLIEGLALRKML